MILFSLMAMADDDVLAAKLAANEIDYAGDTPAAIVTGITNPGYNAHL